VTIASGGVLPKIHPELLRRRHDRKFGTVPNSAETKLSPSPPAKGRKKAVVIKKLTTTSKTGARGPSKVNMHHQYALTE